MNVDDSEAKLINKSDEKPQVEISPSKPVMDDSESRLISKSAD